MTTTNCAPHPDVQNYNVESQDLNRATKITLKAHQLSDSDAELVDRFEQEAQQLRDQLDRQAIIDEADNESTFENLYPSQKRQFLEQYWTPIILRLTESHEAACDAVTDFEDHELSFRAKLQAEYAYHLKHPDVKTRFSSGDFHFNEMLKSGHFDIEGYKLVERRSNGGSLQIVNGGLAPAQGSSTLVFIPNSVKNLLEYANSDLALEYSKNEYEYQLKRLLTKRNAAALALTNAKKSAREQLAAIPTFEQLVSDAVKRSSVKK